MNRLNTIMHDWEIQRKIYFNRFAKSINNLVMEIKKEMEQKEGKSTERGDFKFDEKCNPVWIPDENGKFYKTTKFN